MSKEPISPNDCQPVRCSLLTYSGIIFVCTVLMWRPSGRWILSHCLVLVRVSSQTQIAPHELLPVVSWICQWSNLLMVGMRVLAGWGVVPRTKMIVDHHCRYCVVCKHSEPMLIGFVGIFLCYCFLDIVGSSVHPLLLLFTTTINKKSINQP